MALAPDNLDRDAVGIVAQLQQAGFVAYLVGGCVRDLLLGVSPKDFDIATTASPEELKDLFGRRCRLIGRRFKLAHVRAGAQIFEVATFRGRPEDQESADDSDFVVRANTYGSPEEDALSRDFTINGLFYDPIAGALHDHVGGLPDVERRRLRTIGDAEQRFREDPVRLLRAVKFAGRLGLDLDPSIEAVAREMAPLVHECPVARVTEEIFRLVETGHARPTVAVMRRLDLVAPVLPEVARALGDDEDAWDAWLTWLGALDRQVRAHGVLPRESTFVLATWPLVRRALDGEGDPGDRVSDMVHEAAARMAIPIRHRHALRATSKIMDKLAQGPQRRRRTNLLRSPALPLALTLLRMRYVLEGAEREIYEAWAEACEPLGISAAPFEPRLEDSAAAAQDDGRPGGDDDTRKKRRRRPRRGRRGGDDGRAPKGDDAS